MNPSVKTGIRGSRPKFWQAKRIRLALSKIYSAPNVEPFIVKTEGDRIPPMWEKLDTRSGSANSVEDIGTDLADHLPAHGVDQILENLKSEIHE